MVELSTDDSLKAPMRVASHEQPTPKKIKIDQS